MIKSIFPGSNSAASLTAVLDSQDEAIMSAPDEKRKPTYQIHKVRIMFSAVE